MVYGVVRERDLFRVRVLFISIYRWFLDRHFRESSK